MSERVNITGMPGICVTIGGATMAEVRRRRDDAAEAADLVEVRLDTAADPDAGGAIQGCRRPVLVTCRARWEGGHFDGSEEERLRLLRQAWDLGAAWVDLEAAAPQAGPFLAATGGARVVLSMHDFRGVPADLADRFRAMRSTGAAVVKLAVHAARLADTLPVFALRAAADDRPFTALAMGMAGLPTRVLAARIGSCWTYAGDGWAPGQVPPGRLLDEFGFRRIRENAALYGVVGRPIGHSLSPAMHNAALEAEGANAVYLPLEAADADDFRAFADALAVEGASVTAPFKRDLAAGATLDAGARQAGAINTLRRTDRGWEATNTDVAGFLAPLEPLLPLAGLRAAVLGAGGSARAVAIGLVSRGAHVTIHARRPEQAAEVASATGAAAGRLPPAPGSWDLLVNTTPVGTWPAIDDTPWPGAQLDGRLVYDLVYNPPETRLLRDASAAGCATLGGLEMLVAQARLQYAWWRGIHPDAALMRSAALRRLAAAQASADPHVATGPQPHGAQR